MLLSDWVTTVKEFLKDKKGNLKGAVLVKLSPEKDPKSGRTIMKPVEGSEYKVEKIGRAHV